MIRKNYLTIISFSTIFLFSCKKENVSTPGIIYKLKTANTTSTFGRVAAGSITWTSGYASVSEIEFEAENNNIEIEYKSEIKQKIDLFSSLSTLSSIIVPTGTYRDIEFEIEIEPNGNDAALELKGQYTSGTVITPVVFKVNNEIEIESEKNDIIITDSRSYSALTTLNLSLLSVGITESMLNNATRTNGVIEISSTSNTTLYKTMLERLKSCGGVEVDD